MGLDVTLMPLKKILQNEKRAAEHNAFMQQTGFTLPAGSEQDFGYSEQIGPYPVFHHLWRYAAHIEINSPAPLEPGTHPLDDPAYKQAIAKSETHFDHLLRHSDDGGYYYPIDFPKMLNIQVAKKSETGLFKKMFGGAAKPETIPVTFGSVIRLHKELLDINEFLKVPVRDEVPSETYAD